MFKALPIKVIKHKIESLLSLDLEKITIEDIEDKLSSIFRGLKVSASRYDPGIDIFRGTNLGRKPEALSDIFAPPIEYVKSIGRLNTAGESMFYGSIARAVPFFELNCEAGQHICIGKWSTNQKVILNPIGYSKECQQQLNSTRNLSEIYDFSKITSSYGNRNRLVTDFLAYEFSRKVNEDSKSHYKLTNAIGRKLFGSNGLIKGVMYPTIAMNGNADNIVFQSDFAKNCLNFISAEYVYIKSVSIQNMKFDIEILDTATKVSTDGNIEWNGRPWQYQLDNNTRELTFEAVDGQWVAKDNKGNVVPPN